MTNNVFNYNENIWDSKRETILKNDKLIFEIKEFRFNLRNILIKKYPTLNEISLLKKIDKAQNKKFKNRHKEVLRNILSTSFLK